MTFNHWYLASLLGTRAMIHIVRDGCFSFEGPAGLVELRGEGARDALD
jgi:hypothetical protein